MKVLHLIDIIDAKAGGAMRAVLDTCRALNAEGVSSVCIATTGAGDDLSHLQQDYPDVETKVFHRSFPARYSNSIDLINWLATHGKEFDVVEIHCIFSVIAWRVSRFCAKNKIPYIIRPHCSLDPYDLKENHRLIKMLIGPLVIKRMLEKSSLLAFTATLEAERVVSYGARIRKIIVPLPVDLSWEQGDRHAFHARYNIPVNATTILFLSRIDPKKGLQFLIPALQKVKASFPKVWFVLAGSGDKKYEQKVLKMVESKQIYSFTTITGFLKGKEKRDAFASADLFVLPSLNENFGIVNIEAMNAGVPLMISREVYIYPEVEGAGAGKICEPNVESVEQTLLELLASPSSLVEMGIKAKRLVNEKYRAETAIHSLIACYQGCLLHTQD